MTKYIIQYSNAHWCGGELNVVVNADSSDEAVLKASDYMEEQQRELFSDEYGDSVDEEYEDESAVSVDCVEELDESNEHWKYYNDPSQKSFYPGL